MGKKKVVKLDKLRDRDSNFVYSDYMNKKDISFELPAANPDVLSENKSMGEMYKRGPKEIRAMKLLDEAVEQLGEREKIAYVGYYRDGKTEEEIGELLGIDHSNVSRMLGRALASIVEYCREEGNDLAADGGDDARI